VRIAAIAGALGAAAVGASLFLPWIHLAAPAATAWRDAVDRKIERGSLAPEAEQDFRRLATTLVEEGRLTGVDLVRWARAAQGYGRALREHDGEEPGAGGALDRALDLVRVALLGFPVVGFLLVALFLGGGLKRAPPFWLAIALVQGAFALVIATGVQRGHRLLDLDLPEVGESLTLAPGAQVLLGGGAVLFLAGLFGAPLSSLWRVLLYAAALAAGGWWIATRLLEAGAAP
jgi:hypothetical protein